MGTGRDGIKPGSNCEECVAAGLAVGTRRGTIGQNRDLQFWEFYSGPISHRFETPYVGFVEPLQSGVPDLPSPLICTNIKYDNTN